MASEFISKAYRWLGRRTRKLPLINIEGRQVLASGLFDAEYYARQLKGRPDESEGLKTPLKHYLLRGGFEGLNPSPDFDSYWYFTAYPDVRAMGLNPLVHYVQSNRQTRASVVGGHNNTDQRHLTGTFWYLACRSQIAKSPGLLRIAPRNSY